MFHSCTSRSLPWRAGDTFPTHQIRIKWRPDTGMLKEVEQDSYLFNGHRNIRICRFWGSQWRTFELRWIIASLTDLEFEAYSMKHCVYTQLWAIKSGLFNDADANVLRLNKATFILKESAEDTTLNASNSRDEKTTIPVPKGTHIQISPSGVHYNRILYSWVFIFYERTDTSSARYWEDPHAFKPSRFLNPDWPRDAFIPFSAGKPSLPCIACYRLE